MGQRIKLMYMLKTMFFRSVTMTNNVDSITSSKKYHVNCEKWSPYGWAQGWVFLTTKQLPTITFLILSSCGHNCRVHCGLLIIIANSYLPSPS
jgi:hypothetical protein